MSELRTPEEKVFYPMKTAPTDGTHFIGIKRSGKDVYTERRTWWGKASHIGWRGWCYLEEEDDVESATTWYPDYWRPL